MANRHETTFGNLQIDERFKKLQRSLKLAVMRQEHRDARDMKTSSMTTWPSISSINVDAMDFSCAAPSLQTSMIKSEVLASSNNLRNIFLKKKSHNTKQETMTTSSVKQYHVQQERPNLDRLIMPPPAASTVYRASREPQSRVHAMSNCEKTAPLLSNSIRSSTVDTFSLKSTTSWTPANTDSDNEYLNAPVAPTTPVNSAQKINQVFSNWKVMLNDQYELIIKGTLDCGKVARSKPVIRRYSAICVESKYKHKYILHGNITDERNALPDYIHGKFYNGFPDDWENVYQIWRTYVSQGCPVTFRWPTHITDSDDDLKTELTESDLPYAHVRRKIILSATGSLILSDDPKTKKNTSFEKPFISNSEKEVVPVLQSKHVKSQYEESKQNIKPDVNPPCSSRKVKNKLTLTDALQEDKLNIIINNLADKNCSPKYIEKIIEMFDCLDYVMSYRSESECNNDSVVPVSRETTYSEIMSCGSLRNDSNAIQLESNRLNINKPKNDKDLDQSESETYTGIPKISLERVFKAREPSRKVHRCTVRRKMDAQKHATNLSHNAEEAKSFPVANPMAEKNLISNESCVSITEESEIEVSSNTRGRCQTPDITKKLQEMSFFSEAQRNNFDVYGRDKSVAQNKRPFDIVDAQADNLNEHFIKEQKISRWAQEITHPPFVTDVDYTTNSDVDIETVSTNSRRTGGSSIASHAKVVQYVVRCESNNDLPEKLRASPMLRGEFIKQVRSETAIKKSKPTIISSMPVNLNLRISTASSDAVQPHNSQIIIKKGDKREQDIANIRPLEKTDRKKSVSRTSIATKPTINDSHAKTTVDNKREICPLTNNKNELRMSIATKPTINDIHSQMTVENKREICPITNNKTESDNRKPNPMTNPITEQPKSSKLGSEENPKVLTAWMPKVVHYAKSRSELGLTFQGKLLNEAGHVVNRKFTTDIVLRRLSVTLIETVNHEFYELLGNLNDNKHNIPKELLKQCRHGCPAKIDQFCLTWEKLQCNDVQEVKEKIHDATMDSLNAPVSSRGRHIVPPLSYWIGERITLKDNNPVYSPGNSEESSLLSLTDNSRKIQNNTTKDSEKKQKVNSKNTLKNQSANKQALSFESNKTSSTNKNLTVVIEKSQGSKKSAMVKDTAKNARRSDNAKKSQKSVKNKRRLAQKLTFSSSESSEEELEASPRKTNENADPEIRYTLRKRQKVETTSNRVLRRDTIKSRPYTASSKNTRQSYYSPTKRSKNQEMTYTYHTGIQQSEDFLSETEVSCV